MSYRWTKGGNMTMIPGKVTILVSADGKTGTPQYNPNNSTNCAMALYLLLIADDPEHPVKTPTTSVPSISPSDVSIDDDFKVTINKDVTPTTTYNDAPSPTDEGLVNKQKQMATLANNMANWIITYILTNAVVTGNINNKDSQVITNGKII